MEECPECHKIGLSYNMHLKKPHCTMCHWMGETMSDNDYYEKFQKGSHFYRQKIPHFDIEFA